MGNEQATPDNRFQMETYDAHGGGDDEEKESANNGWILEVDLQYSKELHEEHNSYSLVSEKRVVEKEWMLEYQKSLELELQNSEKLLLTVRLKQLCRALQKLAVLSEAGHETETRTRGAGVRTGMLDGAVHPDEYRIQEKRNKGL